ncbi:MAG TPA: GvpL/GvpF family gas vesicle protein [Candidatus Hypogeohydataceae bacterium YC40]
MSNLCLYVYCISKNIPSLYGLQLNGMESTPVSFLSHRNLAVAFSKITWKAASLKKQVKEAGWVAERVREHEGVVEAVSQTQAVLPMKFLTLFGSESSLLNTLNPHLPRLDQYLEYMQDKEEWSLKVYCDESQGLKHLLETNADLKAMSHKTFRTPGEQYLYMKRMQEHTEKGFGSALKGIIQDIYDGLTCLSVESTTLKIHNKKVTQRTEDMLLNCAFLISKQILTAFNKKIKYLKESYKQWGLLFELSGPWPPYNFCPSLEEATWKG